MFHRWVLYSLKLYDKICSFNLKCEKIKNLYFFRKLLVGQIFEAGGPFRATGGPFGPPVNMLAEALLPRMFSLFYHSVLCWCNEQCLVLYYRRLVANVPCFSGYSCRVSVVINAVFQWILMPCLSGYYAVFQWLLTPCFSGYYVVFQWLLCRDSVIIMSCFSGYSCRVSVVINAVFQWILMPCFSGYYAVFQWLLTPCFSGYYVVFQWLLYRVSVIIMSCFSGYAVFQ